MRSDKRRYEQEITTVNNDPTYHIRGATVLVSCAIPDIGNGLINRLLVEAVLPITIGGPVALELAEAVGGGIADE